MSELLRRAIEAGIKNLPADAVRQLVGELKLPKEVISHTVTQLDETKQGVYRAIGREVHDLFERTNLAEELAKALSLLSLEIKMEVRFKPSHNKTGLGLSADATLKRAGASDSESEPARPKTSTDTAEQEKSST